MSKRVVLSKKVDLSDAGIRLDKYLSSNYPEFSRNHIQVWIQEGKVTVNGHKVKSKLLLKGEEEISINALIEPVIEDKPENMSLNITHEDEAIIILNKPHGLVVHPGAGNHSGTLMNGLLHHNSDLNLLPRAGIIHRLDKNTSGIMVIAKTEKAYLSLNKQMKDRQIEKRYQALVIGNVKSGKIINHSIGRHPKSRTKQAVIVNGREAVTKYKVNKRFDGFTLLDVEIETGRTHQIRVHLSHEKLPIVGDVTYGAKRKFPKGINEEIRNLVGKFTRQALHAKSLTFIHPEKEEKVFFDTPLAEDIEELISQFKVLR